MNKLAASLFMLGIAGSANAASILTQFPQGGYADNSLLSASWSQFTTALTGQHTLTQVNNFDDPATLSNYNAIWVNQELYQTLSVAELTALSNYYTSAPTEALFIMDSNWADNSYMSHVDNSVFAQNIINWLAGTNTQKMVFIGENDSWNTWNQSILSIVGGDFSGACSWAMGTPILNNTLTNGINMVENGCGSTLTNLGNPNMLFSNNMAAIYSSTVTAPVSTPEPSVILLFGIGLAGFVGKRIKPYKKMATVVYA